MSAIVLPLTLIAVLCFGIYDALREISKSLAKIADRPAPPPDAGAGSGTEDVGGG